MNKYKYIIFAILLLTISGCSSDSKKIANNINNSSNNSTNNLNKDYIFEYTDSMDLTQYYLECKIGRRGYLIYYFDKKGNNRKTCYYKSESNINCDQKLKKENFSELQSDSNILKKCSLLLIVSELNSIQDFNVDDNPKLKNTVNEFLLELSSNTVEYEYYYYELGKFYSGDLYKTASVSFGNKEDMTFKFDDNQNLMQIHIQGDFSNDYDSLTLVNARLAIINSKYFNFSTSQKRDIIEILYENQDLEIGNFVIKNTYSIRSFTIQDKRYNE